MRSISMLAAWRRGWWLIALGALLYATPAAASARGSAAGTLVYVKSGKVYVARTDGSHARVVVRKANGWAWPSETDSGIIAVAGGRSRISKGFNPSGSDLIYEFTQKGKRVAGPVPTQGTYSTVNDPEYVTHFRVAPDNSNVAWTVISSFTQPYTSWRSPRGAGRSFSTAGKPPLPYSSPEWWGSGHLLITHDGVTFGTQPEYAVYLLAGRALAGMATRRLATRRPTR